MAVAWWDTPLAACIGRGVLGGRGYEHDAEDLLKEADQAMYRAKRQGKGVYVFADADAATPSAAALVSPGDGVEHVARDEGAPPDRVL